MIKEGYVFHGWELGELGEIEHLLVLGDLDYEGGQGAALQFVPHRF